jgi:hypothetical protein
VLKKGSVLTFIWSGRNFLTSLRANLGNAGSTKLLNGGKGLLAIKLVFLKFTLSVSLVELFLELLPA